MRPSLRLALLLALAPTCGLGLDHHGKLPKPRIRSMAHQLFNELFPPKKPPR